MLAIYKREMRSYFTGIIGYAYLVIFLAVGGVLFSVTTLFSMKADVTSFFVYMMLFSAVTLPLLTMKSFSEERKLRTEQLLLTAPVSIPAMVLGKLLAVYTMFAGAAVVCSLYFLFLYPFAVVKTTLLVGNVLALLLAGLAFASVGLFVSSLTENQLAAAVGTVALLLAFLGIGLLNNLLPANYWLRFVFGSLSLFSRFTMLTNGIFDIASILYYLSFSAVFLYLTMRVFDRRRYE